MFEQKTNFGGKIMYLKVYFEGEFSIFTEYSPSSPSSPFSPSPHLKRVLGISQQSQARNPTD